MSSIAASSQATEHESPVMMHNRVEEPWPIIIGGFYRSGTSLLRRILDSHSRIHCGPEAKFFRDLYGYYFNDPLKHVRFFASVRHLGLDERDLLGFFGAAMVQVHRLAAAKQGKPVWADKNPENVIYLNQWSSILNGNFRFIHCVRSPFDALASLMELGFKYSVPRSFEDKVSEYVRFVEAGLLYEGENTEKCIRLRYEDVVSNPRNSIQALMTFINEPFETEILNFNARAHQKGLEDPKVSKTNTIHRNSIGRGVQFLTSYERDMIAERCRKICDCLGYEVPGTRSRNRVLNLCIRTNRLIQRLRTKLRFITSRFHSVKKVQG